jgi:RNA polymerase sigma-70 factor (ECF subfamily)
MPVPSDDELVVRLVAQGEGAEEALAVLYERYAATVYGLARRVLGDSAQAEDVLQETFWRLWRYADHYRPGRVRFATWLLRITANLAVSEQRRRARRPRTAPMTVPAAPDEGEPLPVDVADPAADVAGAVWRAEQRRTVSAGLATLPPVQRQAVELAYFGGLTHAEIAATQGAPLSTVKTRLALGLRKLGDFLAGRGLSARDCLT